MKLSATQIAALRKISDTCYGIDFSQSEDSITLTDGGGFVYNYAKLTTYTTTVSVNINTGAVTGNFSITCTSEGEGYPLKVTTEYATNSLNSLTDKVKKTLFADSKARMNEAKEKANSIAIKYCLEMNQPEKHKAFAKVGNIIYRAIWAKKPIGEKRIARMFAIANAA